MPSNAPRSVAETVLRSPGSTPSAPTSGSVGEPIVPAPGHTSRGHPIRPIRTTGPPKRNSPPHPEQPTVDHCAWPSSAVARLPVVGRGGGQGAARRRPGSPVARACRRNHMTGPGCWSPGHRISFDPPSPFISSDTNDNNHQTTRPTPYSSFPIASYYSPTAIAVARTLLTEIQIINTSATQR
jgi:hypothetical protein